MFLRNKKLYLAIGAIAIVFLAGILFSDKKNNDVPFAKAAAVVDIVVLRFNYQLLRIVYL